MTWRDAWSFSVALVAVTMVIAAVAGARGHQLDEFDLLHALIVAATVTILRAVRECRP